MPSLFEVCPPCEHISILYNNAHDVVEIYQDEKRALTVAAEHVDSIGDVEILGWSHAKKIANCNCSWPW